MLRQVTRAAWQASGDYSSDTIGLWQSQHNDASRWLLQELLKGRRNLTITSLGGSASAWRDNYGSHLALLLERELFPSQGALPGGPAVVSSAGARINFFNPSHGYTGSDWAALYLDTLIPQETDVLLWEFSINDWPGDGALQLLDPQWSGLKATSWHSQAIELFLRRAIALNPRLVLGFVFLWQPQAARCWPRCKDDDWVWRDDLAVLRHYSRSVDAFAIDVNHLAKNTTSASHLFRDRHHPSDQAHAAIGQALFERFVAVKDLPESGGGAPSDAALTAPRPRRMPQSLQAFSAVLGGDRAERGGDASGELLNALLRDSPGPDRTSLGRGGGTAESDGARLARLRSFSFYYGDPRFGPATLRPVSPDALRTKRTGKVMAERVDNVQHALVPPCSQGNALSYALRARVRRPRFVGINVRGPDGYVLLGAIEGLDIALLVNLTVGGGSATEALTLSAMSKATIDANLTVVGRGVFAPQAWYAVPPEGESLDSRAERAVDEEDYTDAQIRICRRHQLGPASPHTSLRNGAGTFRSTHENVAVVGGVVVLA